MRRFEHAGPPRRYWECTLDGRRVHLRWGDLDRPAKVYETMLPTEDEAARYAERQIRAQLDRGYREVTVAAAVRSKAAPLAVERQQRFEWRAPGDLARRFLEITQQGRTVTVRGGQIVGEHVERDRDQLVVGTFDTAAAAGRVFQERCAEARFDGGEPMLVERSPFELREHAQLEALCLAAPDDPEPWAIYADWLIAHGDERGEIAALEVAGKHDDAKRLIGAHLRDLCGSEEGTFELELRHGFAIGATLSFEIGGVELLEDVTRAFLASPLGRFVERLRFGLAAPAGENDWGPTLHAVATSPRAPHIRALRFDHYDHHQSELSWTAFGDLRGAWNKLPALELLHIKSGAGGTLGDLDLPNLRTFIRESGGLAQHELDAILAARWPRLEHLELWFGQTAYGADVTLDAIRPILDGVGLTALRHLGIVNCEFSDALIPELARSRILPQLTSLDLSKGVMASDAAASLVALARSFEHLARIDVDANYLTLDELARLRGVLPNIVPGTQRELDEERYAAVGE